MPDTPLAYLLSFRTYGTWLHGNSRGSTDRLHNTPGTPHLPADAGLWLYRDRLRHQDVFELDTPMRRIVEATLGEVCAYRGWDLHASNVRTNHVHVVVGGVSSPERMLIDFKAWCTRRLIEGGDIPRGRKVWSRHGSTRYLWNTAAVEAACHYTLEMQDDI